MPNASEPTFSGGLGFWGVFLALAIVVGIILLIRWVVLRSGVISSQGIGGTGKKIHIVERKALGPRQALLLVRVAGKKEVLLHQSRGVLTPLCEFEIDEEEGEE